MTNNSINCDIVQQQIDLFLSDDLDEILAAKLNSHFATCDSCHELLISEMASGIFQTQIGLREVFSQGQQASSLPGSFISPLPEGLREIQFAMPLAASVSEKKMYKFVEDVFTVTIWKIDKDAKGRETVVGLNVDDNVQARYEGLSVQIRSNDKKTLLLKGAIKNGQVTYRPPYSFTRVIEMLPPRLLADKKSDV